MIEASAARATWNGRSKVLRELTNCSTPAELTRFNPRDLTQNTVSWLSDRLSQQVTKETVSKDIGHLRWVWQAMDAQMPPRLAVQLATVQKGCGRSPATTTKALPMTRTKVGQLVHKLLAAKNTSTAIVILLAFETASRTDDVLKLQGDMQAFQAVDEGLAVSWRTSKTNQKGTARPDHTQIVRDPGLLMALASSPKILQGTSQAKITAALKSIKPETAYVKRYASLNPRAKVRETFTHHSLKRGRGEELWKLAAEGSLTIDEVMHKMKHQSLEAALEYAPDLVMAQRAIEINNSQSALAKSRRPRRL